MPLLQVVAAYFIKIILLAAVRTRTPWNGKSTRSFLYSCHFNDLHISKELSQLYPQQHWKTLSSAVCTYLQYDNHAELSPI